MALISLSPLATPPQYLIPMLGMLLGNACSGVAVGLSTVLDELSSGGCLLHLLHCAALLILQPCRHMQDSLQACYASH